MSRSKRKLIWPLSGMATFAIVATLTILVALPVGIVLAQVAQETDPPPPSNLAASAAPLPQPRSY